MHDKITVAIDIGTTKICVLVAQPTAMGFEVIGVGKVPCDGLRKGVVVDVAKTIKSIEAAVKEAQTMAGVSIDSAVIGISGGHIQSTNSMGMVPIKHTQVRQTDIDSALMAAQAITIPEGYQILHVLPQFFVIDGKDRVQHPLGMCGVRLEVHAHIILGSVTSVQNLVICCQQAGIAVDDIILEQLASADAVLSDDERHLGVAMLDIGGGTSDLAMYHNGSIRHTKVLAIAGNHVTNDIAIGLKTTLKDAERIKKQFGYADMNLLSHDDIIEIEKVQGIEKNHIYVSELIKIIHPRVSELLTLIHQEITKRNLTGYMTSGLVLTGGGSLLKGISELAQQIFQVPVRIGTARIDYHVPQALDNPIFATGYGLLVCTFNKKQQKTMQHSTGPMVNRIIMRMKSWVSDFF